MLLGLVRRLTMGVSAAAALCTFIAAASAQSPVMVSVEVDATSEAGHGTPFEHFWSRGIGSGHAALTTRADWREHMKMAHDDLGIEYVRYHAVLDDTSMYTNAPQNKNRQSYFDAISTYSYLISIGVRPVVELSFTPSPLVNGSCDHFYYDGCELVPTDLDQYYEYVYNFTSTLVTFFGADEVRQWYFEVYNEADLHWSFDQYFSLYRKAATAVRDADKQLRVGGPASAFPIWVKDLVASCKNYSIPLDFVSSHAYPTTGGARNAEISGLVQQVSRSLENAAGSLPVLITEWNGVCSSRGSWHDETAQPAFLIAAIDAISSLSPMPSMFAYWAVSDVFTEMGLPADPDPVAFHGGFGLISLYGVPKPGYQAFALLHKAGDWRLPSTVVQHSDSPVTSNLTVIPVLNQTTGYLRIFLAGHGYVGQSVPNRTVTVDIAVPGTAAPIATIWRIDNANCNPKRLWESWGSPNYLHANQIQDLKTAAQVPSSVVNLKKIKSGMQLTLDLPSFGLAVVDVKVR